jgi:hypothetical protein
MSALAVTPYHANAEVSASNRLPCSAEIVGSVAVTGTLVNGASTSFIGRVGRLAASALASVSPSGLTAWGAGRCLAAATPAIMEFDFGSTYASRFLALRALRIASTLRGLEPLAAGLLLASEAFDPAADDAEPAAAALAASTLDAIACDHLLRGAALDLCAWRGDLPMQLDADGILYGQLYLLRPWSVATAEGLTISAVLTGDIL